MTGEPTYIEAGLPSGPTAYIWLTENCAVIKVNDRATHASRSGIDYTDSPERIAELLPLLAAAALPATPRWRPTDA